MIAKHCHSKMKNFQSVQLKRPFIWSSNSSMRYCPHKASYTITNSMQTKPLSTL